MDAVTAGMIAVSAVLYAVAIIGGVWVEHQCARAKGKELL